MSLWIPQYVQSNHNPGPDAINMTRTQYIPIGLSIRGFRLIWYGKGFASLVVIGGICSLFWFTMRTIFNAVFCSVVSTALVTFVRSVQCTGSVSPSIPAPHNPCGHDSPLSVFGVASVTSNRQISQHISSSAFPPFVNQPRPPAFRRRFSKN